MKKSIFLLITLLFILSSCVQPAEKIIKTIVEPVASVEVKLTSLNISPGTLDQTFQSGTTEYNVSVADSVDQVTFTTTASPSDATVTYMLSNAIVTNPINISKGSNSISIIVSKGSGTVKYTVNVIRGEAPSITSTGLPGGILKDAFSSDKYNYTGGVANDVSSITFNPSGVTSGAVVSYTKNGETSTSTIGLDVGDNMIVLSVTKGDVVSTYTFVINRADSNANDNAYLSSLIVSQGTLSPSFNREETSYSVKVSDTLNSITLTATPEDDNASVSGDGKQDLTSTTNTFKILVIAEDNSTKKEYMVTVTKGNIVKTVKSITVSGNSSVIEGNDLPLSALVIYSDDSSDSEGLTWDSSDKSVATVDQSGKVSGLKEGTTTISASKDGKSGQKVITVKAPVKNKIILHAKGYGYVYTWDTSEASNEKKVHTMSDDGNDWYSITLDKETSIKLLFRPNGGDDWSGKTEDLSQVEGEWWYDGEWHDNDPEDAIAPEVSFISPGDGDTLTGIVTLSVNANDDKAVSKVEFYDGIDFIGEATSLPYNISWKTLYVANGSHTITAKAYDAAGNEATDSIIVTTDNSNIPPEADCGVDRIGYVDTEITFTGSASKDNGRIVSYQWDFGDGTTATGETVKHTYTSFRSYSVKLTVTDDENLTDTATISITIKEEPTDEYDFREETIYFAMTARFYDGDPGNNQGKKGDPASDPSWRGDLQGLTQKLDYIKALGFTAVWLTPPVANDSGYDYHGYHASSFHDIDGRIGGMQAYKDFIAAVHSKGMKVVQDIVLNHSGPTGLSYPGGHFSLGTDAYHNAGQINDWEGYLCQTGDLAGADCSDLNTENQQVIDVLIDAYNKYIDMGVDAFRVDTVKHINRMIFNKYFNPAFMERGKQNGKNFYMFGEVCTRTHDVWNKGVYSLSTPFYTWTERYTASGSLTDQVKSLYEQENGAEQRSSDNMFLDGNEYHTPDYSEKSDMHVIDFPMHWNFNNARSAFDFASKPENEKTYSDSTWNVMYVDSHDYGPNSNNRYDGGQEGWASSMSLMWTFRGIPCIYYGSEIEFMAGAPIDPGEPPLAGSGRAYLGDELEGNITASDFGEYTADGKVATTLDKPLAKHLRDLNRIRKAVPALQKGQYSREGCNGGMSFKRRYTKNGIDSFVLVAIDGDATFSGIPGGTYTDLVTGDVQTVSEGGSLSTSGCSGAGNLRAYVLSTPSTVSLIKLAKESPFLK